jgi:lipopolysaccharide transport system ATP-binding protein
MADDTLIAVDGVSKKFCRNLKTSLWYGLQDLYNELGGRRHGGDGHLRPQEFWAVKDVSFELKRGECIGLIGRNGAGKSTLLKMLNGLIKPDQGSIRMHGSVGALIELNAGFNPILTGRENLYIYGQVLGFSKREVDTKLDSIIDFADIGDFLDMPVQSYSSGMKVRLGFAVASQMEPDILLIDEVLAVGDVGFRIKCLNRIQELRERCAVIFVSHSMPLVARICTCSVVMAKGSVLLQSSDVAACIDCYHNAFGSPESRAYGTGDVALENIGCRGANESGDVYVDVGAPLTLEISLRTRITSETLALSLVVWNQDQRPVLAICNEEYGLHTWQDSTERVRVTCLIPALHLAAGKHTVTLAVSRAENGQVLMRQDNALGFIVRQFRSTVADSFLPTQFITQRG